MRDDLTWEVWSRERAQRVEHVLTQVLTLPKAPATLVEAMRHAALGGGKRVRALLAYAAGEFARADVALVDSAAASVELMHAYSLVHDDLPSMDDDVLRRGKPTCHVAFGEATALLAGDALHSLAFEVLARSPQRDAGKACARLAMAAGVQGMAGGQAIDLAAVGHLVSIGELQAMHRMKTGALIAVAVHLGAACGEQTEEEHAALDAFARAAGLAFQIVDDVLDVEGSAVTLGKTAGKDAASAKPTYVSLLGLDAAKAHAERLRSEAIEALAPFHARARRLVELANWIASRRH
ncbi:MAG TPA: farnesyl diphosphate synthase [Casimicrobiaceae bacterium]|nr:farnesyl diphosphate synthase [Casimicrobiaceae bacterium]